MYEKYNEFVEGKTYTLMRNDEILLFFKCIRTDDSDNSIKVRFLGFAEGLVQYKRNGGGYKFGFRDDENIEYVNKQVEYKDSEWIYLNCLDDNECIIDN